MLLHERHSWSQQFLDCAEEFYFDIVVHVWEHIPKFVGCQEKYYHIVVTVQKMFYLNAWNFL